MAQQYPPPAQQYPPPAQPQLVYPPPPPQSNQPAYPPPQGVGYPTQPGYQPVPSQFPGGDAPPPYYNNPPPQAQVPQVSTQQQSSTNVVVVAQQPMPTLVAVHPVRDHYMTMSVVLTVLCVLSGTWWALFCTIPAIVFSSMAQDEDRRGDYAAAQTHGKVALGLNIASLVSTVALIILTFAVVLPVAILASSSDSYYDSYCYSSYYYNNYYYC